MLYGCSRADHNDGQSRTALPRVVGRTTDGTSAVPISADRGEPPAPQSFASRRHRRHKFEHRGLEFAQDEEDRSHAWDRVKLVSAVRNLCRGLWPASIRGYDSTVDQSTVPIMIAKSTEKSRKRKVAMSYHEDLEPQRLDLKLRKVESVVKFQKDLVAQRKASKPTDVVFKGFHRSTVNAREPVVSAPDNWSSPYVISTVSLPLSRHAASTILQSRFTSSNSPTEVRSVSTTRTITKIDVSPLLKKRLGL